MGPFLFSVSTITGLIFLNSVAQRIDSLVGKGLPWSVVVEFLYLSLPPTVALSLPMSVLVAVLYAFSQLTEHNEITAMSAGGVRPTRVMIPVLGMGAIATLGMLFFNNTVLPESNHRLKNLLLDLGRKSPTFQLREQVVNEIQADNGLNRYFLTATRIESSSNSLEEVTIFDRNNPLRLRTTYAERGVMAFNEERTDLYLTLFDGEVREIQADREGGFQRVFFEKQIVPIRGVGDVFDRRMGGSDRGDREMSFRMLREYADEREMEGQAARVTSKTNSLQAVRLALARPIDSDSALIAGQRAAKANATNPQSYLARDGITQRVVSSTRTSAARAESQQETADRARVELQKKWAIAFACLVFTLIGPPLALRSPRGGVGLVIAASTGIFAVYWMGLIGGEAMADRRVADPIITMWIPNAVFLVVGLLLVSRMSRAGATVRGGGMADSWLRLRDRLRRRRVGAAA